MHLVNLYGEFHSVDGDPHPFPDVISLPFHSLVLFEVIHFPDICTIIL